MNLNKSEEIRISKFLSFILRHKPESIGLTLDENGWADTAELIARVRLKELDLSLAKLKQVVANNDKQRFAFSPDFSQIRASQGHSLKIDLQLSPAVPPAELYHGTAERNVAAIKAQGLQKQRRHHVHLSANKESARAVGSRYGTPVVLKVAAARMHEAGFEFFLSENEVWLTPSVPPSYILFP